MAEEMKFSHEKVAAAANQMIKALEAMQEKTKIFTTETVKFDNFLQAEISRTGVNISREILTVVDKTKKIILEGTQNVRDGATTMSAMEKAAAELGRKLRGR